MAEIFRQKTPKNLSGSPRGGGWPVIVIGAALVLALLVVLAIWWR